MLHQFGVERRCRLTGTDLRFPPGFLRVCGFTGTVFFPCFVLAICVTSFPIDFYTATLTTTVYSSWLLYHTIQSCQDTQTTVDKPARIEYNVHTNSPRLVCVGDIAMEQAQFGQRVRERREKEGWSQEKLANEVGISRNYLSQIERGVATNLSWQVVQRLATTLGLREETFARQTERGSLPPGLKEFAQQADLPQGDIEMLAGIQYRGTQPSTQKEWEMLYKAIKIALET